MKLKYPNLTTGELEEVEAPEYRDKRHYVTQRAFGSLFGLLEGHVSTVADNLRRDFDFQFPNQFKVEHEIEEEWVWTVRVTDVTVNKLVAKITRNMGYASDDETHDFD